MDHSEAVRTKASERYLLGEMPTRDREEYEEHFFGCVECAQEVQAGAAFIDSAKDALAAGGVPATSAKPKVLLGGWWTWLVRPAFALPAMALLLLIAGYQTAYEVPRLQSALSQATVPQTLPSLSLISANSRGGEAPELSIPANKPFSLLVDIPPGEQFSAYSCEVQAESGPVEFSVNVSPEEARQTVQVMVPPSKLTAGKYVLVVRGYGGSQPSGAVEVARFPFTLNLSH
jgi:Putative zinc-finger